MGGLLGAKRRDQQSRRVANGHCGESCRLLGHWCSPKLCQSECSVQPSDVLDVNSKIMKHAVQPVQDKKIE